MFTNEFDMEINHSCPFCKSSDLRVLDLGYSVIEYKCLDCEKEFVLNVDGQLIEQEGLDDY